MQVNTVQGSESKPKEDESGVHQRYVFDEIPPKTHASRKLTHCRVASEKGRNGSRVAVKVQASYVSISAK